jgi:hypothetical protein
MHEVIVIVSVVVTTWAVCAYAFGISPDHRAQRKEKRERQEMFVTYLREIRSITEQVHQQSVSQAKAASDMFRGFEE